MPTGPLRTITPTIDVYIKLAQYPILCDRIRLRMREELFRRGIISKNDFEQEVKDLAIESQRREGLNNPTVQEDETAWQRRLDTIRDLHTDNYFANNLGITLLEQLINEVLNNQDKAPKAIELTFNPEIAPWAMLFEQGEIYDALPPPELEKVKHHLEEIKVVLIKRLLSDQLAFIRVAKHIFSIKDLNWIYERLIGGGKIGGKSGGMLLAWHILERPNHDIGPDLSNHVTIPDTYFIGSEIIYEFLLQNKMERYVNQKYLSIEEMRAQYPEIVQGCMAGKIPNYIVEQLRDVLNRLNGRPFVVRSSSLLEDNLDYTFAGKYASVFCP
ncbi:MAG: PEP/pyruvate-binding domain-containing protein, partial [Chloroflexota bacterium]